MIIKKFQGKTEAEATELAQKELGMNVVIMNVKSAKKKGIFQFLKPNLIEITAALEEENERYIEPIKTPLSPNGSIGQRGAGRERKLSTESFFSNKLDILPEEPAIPESDNKAIEEKLDGLQSLLEKQLQITTVEEEEKEEAPSETVVFLQLLYNTMIENEVKEQFANSIIDEIEKMNNPNMPIDHILANIYQKMILKFGKPEGITPAVNRPKIIFLVGPTGVGKTTTIAKIASKFRIENKNKIALLTADTYRIAASEQLKTYASILEVPFRIIYSPEEVKTALQDFKDYDYILIDTAGHSHQNEELRDGIRQLIGAIGDKLEKEVFLVVSATTKYRDLIQIADAYKEVTDFKLIFTKLDETTTLGNLLNLKLHTGAPLSYVTCGQNVPDDIEKFNPQVTVKQLLGGKR